MTKYKLIPMLEIRPEVRKIAVAWFNGFESDLGIQIEQRHKLASDIQNYADSQVATLRQENDRAKEDANELRGIIAEHHLERESWRQSVEGLKEESHGLRQENERLKGEIKLSKGMEAKWRQDYYKASLCEDELTINYFEALSLLHEYVESGNIHGLCAKYKAFLNGEKVQTS